MSKHLILFGGILKNVGLVGPDEVNGRTLFGLTTVGG